MGQQEWMRGNMGTSVDEVSGIHIDQAGTPKGEDQQEMVLTSAEKHGKKDL